MKKLLVFFSIAFTFSACEKATDPGPSGIKLSDLANIQTFTDARDGKVYPYVTIAGIDWLGSNLKYAVPSAQTPGPSTWNQQGYSYYEAQENASKYGYLYNSTMVRSTTAPVCPDGWRLPTVTEMNTLVQSLGGAAVAGGKMKSVSDWISPNYNATNSSKLNFLPAGYVTGYYSSGYYYSNHQGFGQSSQVWLTNGTNLYLSGLTSYTEDVTTQQVQDDENAFYSCRCVRASTTGSGGNTGSSGNTGNTGSSGSTGNTGNNGNTMVDSRDGKVYPTVTIGTQIWMAKNLEFTGSGSELAYNNDNSNVPTYGYLYPAAIATYTPPSGWHLPTQTDIDVLLQYLGGTTVAGGKLKSTSALWGSSNQADNSSGFSFLPGGFAFSATSFNGLGTSGAFGYLDANSTWTAVCLQSGNVNTTSLPPFGSFYVSVRYIKN